MHQMHDENQKHLESLLQRAIQVHPNDEGFWVTCIKRLWNDVAKARDLLDRAVRALPGSQELLLLGAKLEQERGELARARVFVQKAKEASQNDRAHAQAIKLELHFGDAETAWREAQAAVKKHPYSEKLVVLASKVARQHAGLSEARRVLEDGLLFNKTSLLIWSQAIV